MRSRLSTLAAKLALLGIVCAGLAGCVVYEEPHRAYYAQPNYYGEYHPWHHHDRDDWR